MAINSEQTLLNNQSILEKVTLVEEIDEQGAEIISGGQSFNAFEEKPPKKGEEREDDKKDDETLSGQFFQQANFAFGLDRR
ncbi:hypothetical protein NIES2100_21840 [Calothrix sp. NIES-2100]|uniref:hypothetical protein n=1 Tax=Calothrix sp. NIES-2100 TaxID=1954172 RepID=UPI000B621CA4|nr:hypothetical protein NIES2100_21840 [Calothrix sp. NIES-2100]